MKSDFPIPAKPMRLSANATWAGGVDGGCWIEFAPTNRRHIWLVKLSSKVGEKWIQGEFWQPQAAGKDDEKLIFTVSHVSGGQIYLIDGSKLLPIGQHTRWSSAGDVKTISYPPPSADYIDASKITESQL